MTKATAIPTVSRGFRAQRRDGRQSNSSADYYFVTNGAGHVVRDARDLQRRLLQPA